MLSGNEDAFQYLAFQERAVKQSLEQLRRIDETAERVRRRVSEPMLITPEMFKRVEAAPPSPFKERPAAEQPPLKSRAFAAMAGMGVLRIVPFLAALVTLVTRSPKTWESAKAFEKNAHAEARRTRGKMLMAEVCKKDCDLAKVNALLKAGADLGYRDANGNTALMGAAYNGHVEAARAIAVRVDDLDEKNGYGATATDWAKKAGHDDIATIISEQRDARHVVDTELLSDTELNRRIDLLAGKACDTPASTASALGVTAAACISPATEAAFRKKMRVLSAAPPAPETEEDAPVSSARLLARTN